MRRTGLILACAALCGLAHGVEFTLGVGAYEGRAAFKQLRVVDASGKEVYSNDFASPDSFLAALGSLRDSAAALPARLRAEAIYPEYVGEVMALQRI